MLRASFFIALLLTASLSHAQNSNSPSLVIHLFRHGARAPLHDTYAKDWDPNVLGELTAVGERQHYLLGRALADQYPDLLGQSYDPSRIYARAATQTRIIESLQSQLDGVYDTLERGEEISLGEDYPTDRAFPPFESAEIEQESELLMNSEAIPGGYTPIASDLTSDEGGVTLLDPTQVCFNLVDNIIENVVNDMAISLWEDLAPTRQALKDAGLEIKNPYDLGTLGDALVCDYYDDRTLPGNIDPQSQIYLNTTFARNWYFTQALWGGEQQRQLLSVPLYYYILKYFDAKAAGTTNYQFMFLSTAETNLIDLLATLNIVTADCLMENYQAELAGQSIPNVNCIFPEFAASILVEFYDNDGSQSVVFRYNNVPIPICNGQTECSYDDFKNLIYQNTNNYTPDDYQRDCLGRSLPGIEKVLKAAGEAFQMKTDEGKEDLSGVLSAIKGEDDEDGEDHHFFGSTFHDASESFHEAGESFHEHLDNFFGRGNN